MKNIITLVVAVVSIALSATRVYDIEPFKNYNGWVAGDPQHGVGQIFVATCDSFLWVDMFIGAPNDTNNDGHYNIVIQEGQNGPVIATGQANAGVAYDYTRAYLTYRPGEQVLKGREYILKVTHSNGDSINFYYVPKDTYKYGHIVIPNQPPNAQSPDLAARVEGITRIPQDLFGTEIGMSFSDTGNIASC